MDTRILKQFLNASLKPLRRQREVTLIGPVSKLKLISRAYVPFTYKRSFKRVPGFIHSSVMYEATAGVPQGGIISLTIANMVLNGLENAIQVNRKYLTLIRDVEDFVVVCKYTERALQLEDKQECNLKCAKILRRSGGRFKFKSY
jgi:hypothetical protein